MDDIWTTIAEDNEPAADDTINRILHRARLKADFPLSGRSRPDLGRSVRMLAVGRYIILYEPSPDGILVVTVVHGARDPARWLE